jgi:hypothetical protein
MVYKKHHYFQIIYTNLNLIKGIKTSMLNYFTEDFQNR